MSEEIGPAGTVQGQTEETGDYEVSFITAAGGAATEGTKKVGVYLKRLAEVKRESAELAGGLEKREAEWEEETKIACAESMQKPGRDLRLLGESVCCEFRE